MTASDQQESTPKPHKRFVVRLGRNLILYYKKPGTSAEQRRYERCYNFYNFYQRLKQKLYDKPRFTVEVAALVVVIFYTLFAGIQSCELIATSRATKRSADAAVAAVRGWLVPIDSSPPPIADIGPTSVFPIKIENTGQTPAMDLELTEEFKFWDRSPVQARAQFGACPASRDTMFSGALGKGARYTFDKYPMKVQLTDDQRRKLSHSAMILVRACIKYRTISGDGSTDYCIIAYAPIMGGASDPHDTAPCYPKSLDLR